MSIRIIRLGTPRDPEEGLRIGTVRRPPRGVRKEEYARRAASHCIAGCTVFADELFSGLLL
jgi:uncharacterized protein YeaO (DUF488 family)